MSDVAFQKVLVPVNDSDLSQRVILKSIELAIKGIVGELVILSIWEADEIDYTKLHSSEKEDTMKEKAQNILDTYEKQLSAKGIKAEYVRAGGDPTEMIIHAVENGDYDLIIMGSRKLNKLQELIYNSVSDHVARLVAVPVLLVK